MQPTLVSRKCPGPPRWLSEEGGVVAWESPLCSSLRPGVGSLIVLNALVRGRPPDVDRVVAVSDSFADLVGGYGQALVGTHLICANLAWRWLGAPLPGLVCFLPLRAERCWPEGT